MSDGRAAWRVRAVTAVRVLRRGAVVAAASALLLSCAAPQRCEVPLPPGVRSLPEVQSGFDREKRRFEAVYVDYFRQFPQAGTQRIYLTLTIAPDGTVAECVPGSRNQAPAGLTRVVIDQMRKIHFGPRDVAPFHYENYPIVFVQPSAGP